MKIETQLGLEEVPQDGYDHISEGVRELVRALSEAGHETTDSGDGSNHAAGMECALPYRHVFGIVPDRELSDIVAYADGLLWFVQYEGYPEAKVEISYSPGEPAIFMIFPDGQPD